MSTHHPKVDPSMLLKGMSSDGYYPSFLVDKVRDVLLGACLEIELLKPADHKSLYEITCRATERINDLQDVFGENDSEIETVARDDIAESFGVIAAAYGFPDADLEELVATRDW